MTKRELKQLTETVNAIQSLTRVFQGAADRQMKMVKVEIDTIGGYLASAQESYSSAKYSLISKVKDQYKSTVASSLVRSIAKEEVLVLVSSKSYYFGGLIPSLFKMFLAEYEKTHADSIILGATGKELLHKANVKSSNISFYDFDDVNFDWQKISAIAKIIARYQRIVIFYGNYRSVLTQEATHSDISQMVVYKDPDEKKKYLFVPKLPEDLAFLEEQIISGAFLQKIYQAQVAKYAARIKILEIGQVAEELTAALDNLAKNQRRFRKYSANKKQSSLYGGAGLWQTQGIASPI